MKERKPDGGLAEMIDFIEMTGDDPELLCLLLELRRHREDKPALIEQLEAAQRDGLQLAGALNKARAELKRRDAQEPVLFTSQRSLDVRDKVTAFTSIESAEEYGKKAGWLSVVPLYAAAPAAALPQEKSRISENGVPLALNDYDTGWNECLTAAIVLGCQPEKVVKLPETYWTFDDDQNPVFDADKVIEALDTAGVKWVEGE